MYEIELNETEKQYLSNIDFNLSNHDEAAISCENSLHLMKSLISRKAIPEVRVKYLKDPNYNLEARKSRIEVFESNGKYGEDIFRHPHFIKHLKYIVYGPDVKRDVKFAFMEMIESFGGYVSGSDTDEIKAFIRKHFGSKVPAKDKKKITNEVFMLCLEAGLTPDESYSIIKYVK